MTTKTSVFEILSKLDVSAFTEKKGRFSYLSWSDAVDELLKRYPEAEWSVVKDVNGYPYTSTPAGCFVEVQMRIEGISRSQIHPVLDNNNKTVLSPNAFQINTSLQRCLAKVIGLHGLGLYIYRGEDLPVGDDSSHRAQVAPDPIRQKFVDRAVEVYREELIADKDEPDYERMQKAESFLTNDEKIAALDAFGKEKVPETNRMFKNVINECLKWRPSSEEVL